MPFVDSEIYLINLDRNSDRLHHFDDQMSKAGLPYTRIPAVDGSKDAVDHCPCLPKGKYNGTKGLHLSNLNAFRRFLKESDKEWLILFEDDAVIPANFMRELEATVKKYPHATVINLDKRNGIRTDLFPGCCTSCVAYHRSVLPMIINESDYDKKDNFINNYQAYINKGERINVGNKSCMFDWFLANLLTFKQIPTVTNGIVESLSGISMETTIPTEFT